MRNTAMSEASPFLVFNPLAPYPNGVDRLRLIPANAGPSSPSTALTVDDALARLQQAGLACEIARRERCHIHGGANVFVDGGIRGYEDAFVILESDGQFLAIVSGAGGHQHDEEHTIDTLSEAVDAVLSVYRRRGALGPVLRGK